MRPALALGVGLAAAGPDLAAAFAPAASVPAGGVARRSAASGRPNVGMMTMGFSPRALGPGRSWAPRISPRKAAQATAWAEPEDEFTEILRGLEELRHPNVYMPKNLDRLRSVEDFVGFGSLVPMILVALGTAVTGEFHAGAFAGCALATFAGGLSHLVLAAKTPRDFRAPRLGEERSMYEFSGGFICTFSWLLLRMNELFPASWEAADVPMALLTTAVTIYGFAYAEYGKYLLREANEAGYEGPLEPSHPAFVRQAQMVLAGNAAINVLAGLFLPFMWTLVIRGTEWWERVQMFHPNQAAFMGLSVLVAILGDALGALSLRVCDLGILRSSSRGILALALVYNAALVVVPEVIFHGLFSSGVSEVGFYWE